MTGQEKEYNLRQLNLMQQRIHDFLEDKLELSCLINDLEALLNCMENVDKEWDSKFRNVWGILEDTYAFALHEDRNKLSIEDKREIERSEERSVGKEWISK